jgi:hypothetical protein
MKFARLYAVLVLFCTLLRPAPATAWSLQDHILITRLAALRIINDPTAPRQLRDFFRANCPSEISDCEHLARTDTLGTGVRTYHAPLDHWCTEPDIIQRTPAGQATIAPFGVSEAHLHFLGLEFFSDHPWYSDDLSHKPPLSAFPHDVHDPRYQQAGFVPLRVEDCYHRLIAAWSGSRSVDNPDAIHWAGYLAHYVEDSHQPHHATEDYHSYSYLAGHVPGIPEIAGQPTAEGRLAMLRIPRDINPHLDLEYQLFADHEPPRDEYRAEFWKDLQSDITQLASAADGSNVSPAPNHFDPFHWDLEILSDSYDYLPLIGRAAQSAYATGDFDPKGFFTFQGQSHGRPMTIIELIAWQNAQAVLHTEFIWRMAWLAGHPQVGQR